MKVNTEPTLETLEILYKHARQHADDGGNTYTTFDDPEDGDRKLSDWAIKRVRGRSHNWTLMRKLDTAWHSCESYNLLGKAFLGLAKRLTNGTLFRTEITYYLNRMKRNGVIEHWTWNSRPWETDLEDATITVTYSDLELDLGYEEILLTINDWMEDESLRKPTNLTEVVIPNDTAETILYVDVDLYPEADPAGRIIDAEIRGVWTEDGKRVPPTIAMEYEDEIIEAAIEKERA